jgi:MFS family permease
VLALVVRFTIDEPVRGQSEGRSDSAERPGIVAGARFLFRRKSFIHLALGSGLASFNGYAVVSWFPTFLYRSHGMDVSEIGVWLGLILGLAGGLGFAGGGYVADRLGRRGSRYSLWGVVAATMLGWAFHFFVYLAGDEYRSLAFFIVPAVFTNFYLATTFAQVQGLAGLRMRAVASALLLFILNIIGLGLGPQTAGILSDLLAASLGAESLRYTLLIVGAVIGPWSALHYVLAARHIEQDLSRAEHR